MGVSNRKKGYWAYQGIVLRRAWDDAKHFIKEYLKVLIAVPFGLLGVAVIGAVAKETAAWRWDAFLNVLGYEVIGTAGLVAVGLLLIWFQAGHKIYWHQQLLIKQARTELAARSTASEIKREVEKLYDEGAELLHEFSEDKSLNLSSAIKRTDDWSELTLSYLETINYGDWTFEFEHPSYNETHSIGHISAPPRLIGLLGGKLRTLHMLLGQLASRAAQTTDANIMP